MCRISRKNNLALHALLATTTNQVLLLLCPLNDKLTLVCKNDVSLYKTVFTIRLCTLLRLGVRKRGSCLLAISLLCLPYVTRSHWLLDPAE